MEKPLSDSDVQAQGSKFDVQIPEEASYLLWYIWRGSDPAYSKLQDCIAALEGDAELYDALKVAHVAGKYAVIRQWEKCFARRNTSHDLRMGKSIGDVLLEIQPMMKRLVMGDIVLPTWSPSQDFVDADTVSHLSLLKIPCLKGKPNLLLHDLGSFARDVELERRLKNIFMANNHTFLVNTSGSGKTRLLLEGLCENWGFYFTSLVDSSLLGSSDVQNSIQTHVPDSHQFRRILPPMGSSGYDAALKANRDIANRVFRQIFLSRLIIFNLFTETMLEYINTHEDAPRDPRVFKTRWLLLQLQPSFVHPQLWDVFDELSSKLSEASDSFINTRTKALLTNTRSMCSRLQAEVSSTPIQMSSSDIAQIPLFCVLDEAQHAATQHSLSFRSDHNGSHRPILREIVKAWEGQSFGQGVFMVVAGTGISKDVVDQAMASAIMKDSKYRWCSDTGAFDTMVAQQKYLRKYLPESFLASESGVRLLERIWYWLHGRYRFTTGYVAELLLNGFKRPHGLLNAYIQHFTNFAVTDALRLVQNEGTEALPIMSQYRLDFSKLKRNSDMLSTIHQLTTHYLMRSVLPVSLGKDEAIYVEYGFARFVDAETKTVAVDEPLVLLAAANWINANHRSSYKFFAKQIHIHDPDSNGFENYIAYCIDMLFSHRRRVNEVFLFNGAPPTWSSLEAELVALHRVDTNVVEESLVRHCQASGPSVTLGTNAKSPECTLRWLAHGSHTPICFPHISMGPDLLFVLRLSDKSLIWVAVQAKYSSGKNNLLSRPYLRRAMRSVTPCMYFIDKEGKRFSPTSHPGLVDDTTRYLLALPHRRSDAGKFGLLRVVASFPADTNLKRCLEEDPDADGHPIASLNMALIKQVTKRLSPIDFLQGLEDPLQKAGKRKRGVETTKRRTKIKLN
ncbi:hypothetical protein HYPSUDRAFT_141950 [Hypholoma sublateritium FD-334 SS-4]|uniref:Uncharacterized protein n=1 Tax=Hypholoma sublateritium (strain FD-334 SS-4) TaxID=945553 RepID=A0A0D2PL37_HYPSF|nr:hypothetical protein HYPSUDRAFT_141950 [Hypholoma sublateritium FD-334 SS-4]